MENTNYDFRRANFDAMLAVLMMRFTNSDAAQGFELHKNGILKSCRQHIPNKCITINNPSWIKKGVKLFIARHLRAYGARKRNKTDETSAEFCTVRWPVKRAVKHAKHNKK